MNNKQNPIDVNGVKLQSMKKDLLHLRIKKAYGDLLDTSQIKKIRKDIARLNTVLSINNINKATWGQSFMPRKVLQGTIVSNCNDKTIIVLVVRRFQAPLYKKIVSSSKRYSVHDPDNAYKNCSLGVTVSIMESPPISKSKRWTVLYSDNHNL